MQDSRLLSWIHLPEVDSTMVWVKEHAASFTKNAMTVVYADHQTASIGQHGRKWVSFAGLGLYATLFFQEAPSFPYLQNIGQIMALSCVEVLERLNFSPKLKWPNDLLLEGKKCGGILVESTQTQKECSISVGIGINVNATQGQLNNLHVPSTSLLQESGRSWKIDELLFQIVERFRDNFEIMKREGFSSFARKIETFLAYLEKEVPFFDGKSSFKAICKGIDDLGRLKLEDSDGNILLFTSGSIAL